MKVALIFSTYPIPAQRSWFQLRQKVSKGQLVVFQQARKNREDIRNLRVHSFIDICKAALKHPLLALKRDWKRLRYQPLVAYQPDIIHLIDAHLFTELRPLIPSTTKLVVTFRGFDTLVEPHTDPHWNKELQEIYQRADRLHFVSEHLKQAAIRLGAPSEKCIVIHQSVDTTRFSMDSVNNKPDPQSTFRIVSTGRLVWEKGYVYALEAIHRLVQQQVPVHYDIFGGGPNLHELHYHIRRLQLEQHCKLHGQTDHVALNTALQTAHVYLLTSLTEGIPNAILEASYAGLPVVSTNAGGIPEAVQHEHTGLLSAPADAEAIAEHLHQLYRNPALALQLGRNGHHYMLEHFGEQNEVSAWENVYHQLYSQ